MPTRLNGGTGIAVFKLDPAFYAIEDA